MAGVISIPKIHITTRAMWWLAKCETVFGGIAYPVPVDMNACETIMPCINARTGAIDWAMVVATAKDVKLRTSKEWLQYGPGLPSVIATRRQVPKLWQCSVADMRALVMGMPIAIDANPTKADDEASGKRGYQWVQRDVIKPTCTDCCVLMDMMLANHTPKTGTYPTKVDSRDGVLADWKSAP